MRKLFFISLFLLAINYAEARTIVVGPGGQEKTLREAVRKASPGDTILVRKAVYKEGNIIVSKPLTLLGIDGPVLDGDHKHEILTISARGVVVRGFQFANAGYSSMNDYAAVKIIDASKVLVDSNVFTNTFFAIHIANTTHSTVRRNKIRGTKKSEHLSGNGIHLWKCDQMLIENNFISGHRDGIYFEFVTASTIKGNVSEQNVRYGLHFMFSHSDTYLGNTFRNNGAGVAVMYSRDVRMERNHFDKNWGASAYGILLKDISDSHIQQNKFVGNTVGIHMEGSSRIIINKNEFRSNGWAIKVQASCDDNQFNHNNFFANSFDVATNGTMTLNKFSGNYWDKYEGYDLNRDGRGDVPYHPVSMYAMIVEQNPTTLILMRSFMVSLLDRAEKAIPSLTPESLADASPMIKPNKL